MTQHTFEERDEIKNVFVCLPARREFRDVFKAVREALLQVKALYRVDFNIYQSIEELQSFIDVEHEKLKISSISDLISQAHLIILDISEQGNNLLYELGSAHAQGKSTFILAQTTTVLHPSLEYRRKIIYDRIDLDTLTFSLERQLVKHLFDDFEGKFTRGQNPLQVEKKPPRKFNLPLSVFISYDDKDTAYFEQLRIHLNSLTSKDKFKIVTEKEPPPGSDKKAELGALLDEAAITVILISPDYITSDLYKNTLEAILKEKSERRDSRICPLWIRDCDIPSYLEKFQFIRFWTSPEPHLFLNELQSNQLDTAYKNAAKDIERLILPLADSASP